MKSNYKPKYAEGEILVGVKGYSKDFVKQFGKTLGYELIDEWEHGDNVYIFRTPVNKEDIACKKFLHYKDFVEWAERRDVKLESRWKGIEKTIGVLKDLGDKCEISDEEYRKKIDEIIDSLKSTFA